MNTILIKGDNDILIQKRIDDLKREYKSRGYEAILFDGNNNKGIREILIERSLFEEKRLLIFYGNIGKEEIEKYIKLEKVEEYKLPKVLYKFLESFYPNNFTNSKILLTNLLKDEPIEMIFAVLIKHVTDLLRIKIDPKSMHYPDWRMMKLENQSEKYSLPELKGTIKNLSLIDIKTKTSKGDLLNLLDLMMLGHLE